MLIYLHLDHCLPCGLNWWFYFIELPQCWFFAEKHLGKDDPDARMAGLEMPQPLPGNDEEIKASMVFQKYEEGFGKLSGVTEMR